MNNNRKKKKRKSIHYTLYVTDDPKVAVTSRRLSETNVNFWKVLIAILLFAFAGFVAYNNYNSSVVSARENNLKVTIDNLKEDNEKLTAENQQLTEKVNILSETINQKVEVEQTIEEKSVPTGFPLSAAADYSEKDEPLRLDGENITRPMLEFTAGDGTWVYAAGDGTVSYVGEEATYGWEVRVDHGNGYVTVYRTNTEPKVKQGDEVARGVTLYEMKSEDDDPAKLCYQIILNEEYINPTEVLDING